MFIYQHIMQYEMEIKKLLKEKFDKFVIRNPEGCWDWNGCCPKNPGYGQFWDGIKIERAHRASWILHFGDIPKGMFVCHKCDNKRCSNPDHLFLATCKENNLDAIKKNLHPTIGKKGSKNCNAKLSEEDVKKIRFELRKNEKSRMSQIEIAKKFNVSQSNISLIDLNINWSVI